MSDPNELNALAEQFASAVERRSADERMLAKVKARFYEKVLERQQQRNRLWIPAGALTALAALAVAFLTLRPPAPLAVTARGESGAPTEYVLAAEADQPLDFSDGSEVVVRSGSALRLNQLTEEGASATLERGAAHVKVVHRAKTQWTFTAGPYRVHVVGTRFELSWNPDTTRLEVQMEEGVVEVDGPGLGRRRVTNAERLEAFVLPPVAEEEVLAEPLPEPKAERSRPSRKSPPPLPVVAQAPLATPTWRYLANTGDAEGAVGAAEAAGFSSLAGSLPKHDVMLLGDTARKAQNVERARDAYLAARHRFPGSNTAIEAAMRLGELSAQRGQIGTAARWFEKAYDDAPNGSTAIEALGGQLEMLSRFDEAAARPLAKDYLRRFPNGPHAARARELLR